MKLIIGNLLFGLGLVLGWSLPLTAQEKHSQTVQTADETPLPQQSPGAGQKPNSPNAGGTDPNLPQHESKAAALSGSPVFPTQDSEEVKQRKFVAPDVPEKVTHWTSYSDKYFAIRFSLAVLVDYDAFWQDSNSHTQVGAQRDQWDDRSTRFMLSGGIGPESYRVHYFASYAWNGFDAPQNKKPYWNFSDLIFTFPVGKLGAITFGKSKEPFVYEMVGDAAFLPSLERVLNPFFNTRNVGVTLSNTVFDERVTYSGGWYNDWWVQKRPFDGSSNQFAARITGLLSINEDGSRYLHLGAGVRYAGASDGAIQLRGKPESDVTSFYVDTGKIPASNQKEFGFEVLWNRNNCSILTEYVQSQVNATHFADPWFYGVYVTGSWIITGEHRPYDRNVGFARRLIPEHRWGAFELAARYSRLDLDNKSVHGGVMDKGLLDFSWYPNRWWRFSIAGGFTSLNRVGLTGYTTALQTRIQFVY